MERSIHDSQRAWSGSEAELPQLARSTTRLSLDHASNGRIHASYGRPLTNVNSICRRIDSPFLLPESDALPYLNCYPAKVGRMDGKYHGERPCRWNALGQFALLLDQQSSTPVRFRVDRYAQRQQVIVKHIAR